ncbi:MAG TPA: PBP1A family penicillin-binding protein [Actinomycetota bacterium]|jgi:penicillin-binding protein 1A
MRAARAAVAMVSALLFAGACSLPPIDLRAERPLDLRTTIVAADGQTLARLYKQNRSLVQLDDVPKTLVDAVLASEDARFYRHGGFDLRSIARAALVNLEEGEVVQGGSTITQQYVKNTYFRRPARTFARKARELRLALEIERRYSKDEILERYLNTLYWGEGAYGVRAAAETYFGHGVGRLTLDESALLAALIKSPAYYDPRDHPGHARTRRNYVLDRMVQLGWTTRVEAREARHAGLGVTPRPPRIATRRPYFVEAVKREILTDRRFGSSEEERARSLYTGGLKVETTLEPDLQRAAEGAVRDVLDQPGDPEAALVALRPRSGRIVAMVGGRSWSRSQVNLALGRAGGGSGRQPGSAFKPLVLATALEAGIPLATEYESGPVSFTFDDGSTWSVSNSEGGGYGDLSLEEAMVHSVNGVYARLGMDVGPDRIAGQAQLMGVRSKLDVYPSIALGTSAVSVLDMATAYATLANYGRAVEPTTIDAVTLPDGQIVQPDQETVEAALSAGNAYQITKTLEQVVERGTGTAAQIGRPVAGKTGTTNDFTDAWFVGYTPQLVTAVWVGYPEGLVPMTDVHGIRVYGGTFPALIWRSFMSAALARVEPESFEVPRGSLVTVEIDPESKLLAAPWCRSVKRTMLRELVPTETCPMPPPSPLPSLSPTTRERDRDDGGKDRGKDKDDDERKASPEPEPKESDKPGSDEPKPKESPKGKGG